MVFSNILYPVDFSERCRTAAPYVAAVTKTSGASLTLIHFVEMPVMWYGAAEAPCMPEFNTPRLTEEAEHRLAFFGGECFPGIDTHIVVDSGEPGSCIVQEARDLKSDLIMMPTRGRGAFRAALLGSVTAKVLHDAECPVWTAAHCEDSDAHASPEWRKIVCAVDTNADGLCLIRRAAELAKTSAASVHLVHAIQGISETRPEKYLDRDFEAFLEDSARATIGRLQRAAGTNFPVSIEPGKVSAVVANTAGGLEADLVLIARGGLPHIGGRLRTNVYAIIRDVPCPVLSI